MYKSKLTHSQVGVPLPKIYDKKKNSFNPYLIPYTKLTQMDQRPNCKSYIGVYLCSTDLGNGFLGVTSKAWITKEKLGKLERTKVVSVFSSFILIERLMLQTLWYKRHSSPWLRVYMKRKQKIFPPNPACKITEAMSILLQSYTLHFSNLSLTPSNFTSLTVFIHLPIKVPHFSKFCSWPTFCSSILSWIQWPLNKCS